MTYPMSVRKLSFDHSGGTKSYHLLLISNSRGESVLVYRWGKTGTFGQIKVETYLSQNLAMQAWGREEKQRMRKGYRANAAAPIDTAADFANLKSLLGTQMTAAIGGSAISHLDPTVNTTGMREPEEPTTDPDDSSVRNKRAPRTRQLTEEELAQAQREKFEAETAALRTNPNFGLF